MSFLSPRGRLKIHAAITGIFRLGRLDARGPFAVAVVHSGPDLGEDDLRDICSVQCARPHAGGFSKVAAVQEWNDLAKNRPAFRRTLPCGHGLLGSWVNFRSSDESGGYPHLKNLRKATADAPF